MSNAAVNQRLARINDFAPDRLKRRAEAASRFGAKAERYARALLEGDALADPVAAEIREDRDGKAKADLETAIELGLAAVTRPSAALTALFEQLERPPAWVDWEEVERGGVAFLSRGAGLRPALAAALAAGYNSAASVKPLVRTGRFVTLAGRRASETANWYFKTLRPGGLRRGAAGYTATVRVRIVHSMVRAALKRSNDWNVQAWGAPLNMADTARGIATEFTTVPIDAGRVLGYDFTPSEAGAFIHLFRYVGHLLGVPGDLLPQNEAEARELGAIIDLTNDGPDDDCRILAESLLEIGYTQMKQEGRPIMALVARNLGHGYVRAFAGAAVADGLKLRDNAFKYVPLLTRPFLKRADRRLGRMPYAQRLQLACAYADQHLGTDAAADVVDPLEAGRAVSRAPAPLVGGVL
jgi:hypothetical protein